MYSFDNFITSRCDKLRFRPGRQFSHSLYVFAIPAIRATLHPINPFTTNDLSYSAHASIACFLGAAHETMLETLKAQHDCTHQEVLRNWNSLMKDSKHRAEFFETVVKTAKTVHHLSLASHLKTQCFSTEGNVDTRLLEPQAGQKRGSRRSRL